MIFKSIKKAFLWTSLLLVLMVLLVGGGYVALRSPRVQTWITQYIAGKLSEELGTVITVGGVDIGFFNRLILEDLYVEDLKGDTLTYIDRLHLGVSRIGIEKRKVYLSKVRLDNLTFHLQKYEGDEKLNIQFLIDYFAVPKDTTNTRPWDIRSRVVELRNASFVLRNHYAERKQTGVDYKALDIRRINLLIDDIRIDTDTILGNIRKLNCYDLSGFKLKNFRGKVKVSPTELKVDDLIIQTPTSDLDLDLHYTYSGWTDYISFIDSVRMDYVIRKSALDLKDVAYFAPALHGLEERVRLSGHVYGPVSSLNARDLELQYGQVTQLRGNLDLDGLPNIRETFLYIDLKNLTTDYRDLKNIPQPPFDTGNTLKIPSNIANLGHMQFKGSFTGFINDFVAYGKLRTSIGSVQTDISLKQDKQSGQLAYSGDLRSFNFDLGKFLSVQKLGKVSLSASVDGKGLTKEQLNARMIGQIQSAELVGYEYRNIDVNGEFAKSMFSGEVLVNDTNLRLTFRGGIDLSQALPEFNFYADVRHADLYALNLLRSRENAIISGVTEVDFIGDDIDNLIGSIEITNGTYQQKGDPKYAVKRFSLNVNENDHIRTLQIRSGILDADFNGKFKFRSIPLAVNDLIRKHLPSYAGNDIRTTDSTGMDFQFGINLKNTDLLTYLFVPELSISDSSSFQGSYSSAHDDIFLRGRLNEVVYKTIKLKNVQIEAENPGKEFQLGFAADRLSITDSIYLTSFDLRSFTFNDSLGLVIKWDNRSELENSGFIQGVAAFPKNKQVSFHLDQTNVTVAGMKWDVAPNNLVRIDSTTIELLEFAFNSNRQSISVNGRISRDPKAKLKVGLRNFDLSNFNVVTQPKGIRLQGTVSGQAQLSGLYDKLFLTNQLTIDSLMVNGVEMGSGEMNNTWVPSTRSIQVFGLLARNDKTSLSVVGEFFPGNDRPQNFNIKALVEQLPLNVFDPYINKVLTEVHGTAKADLSLKGKLKDPQLTGKVLLNNADFLFTYLNTRYYVTDTVTVKKDGFYFNNISVADERGSRAKVNGWVKHTAFKDLHFDARLDAEDFMALNTNSAMNSLYYGKAFGSGTVRFSGRPKNMHLDVAMRTERGTQFNIPLYGASSVSESDFITFVKPPGVEDEKLVVEQAFQVDFQNLTLDMDIEATNDAEVQLIFDPKVGDIIKGRGQGDLTMSLDRDGNFKMFGEYYINKGEYLFTLQNIINKKFLIEQGSTINWSGSPYEALVNITAKYGVRTSLYDLMYPDTSDVYKRRIQVDCILKMTGNLLTPNIAFDIDLPNSDERLKTEVRNKIGIGNEQEMNRQIFGLLVLNRFFPTEEQNQVLQQAGGFFTASTTEMLSNQLSNWLSKISNDFDVGLNYRPGDNITNDELQVALSTQLFNNRIIIDGNVGVANTRSASGNIVGDVNIEYKITSDGRFRVRFFNKSNDINSLTYNAPFTQGIGLSYQKEFNRLGDLFRRRKKKDYLKAASTVD